MRRVFVFSIALISLIPIFACVSDATDPCDPYCKTISAACTGGDAQYVFADGTMDPIPACKAMCAAFPMKMEMVGNTLRCRQSQLSLVDEVKGNAMATHERCMDAGPFSEICGGRVPNYCELDLSLCGMQAFATQQDCQTAFQGINDDLGKGVNDMGVPATNTKICRFYHLGKASLTPATHCPHTKAPVSPVCTM